MDSAILDAKPLPHELPFWHRSVTLGRVSDGSIRFTKTVAGKLEMLQSVHAALHFVAWTGNHTTDLFTVTAIDAARLLEDKR